MTADQVIDTLRKRFRRRRYELNKLIRVKEERTEVAPAEWHREAVTWLAAERELERIEREIKERGGK